MSFSATLFLFMFNKTFRWLILFVFCLLLIACLINDCSIKQNDKMACQIVKEHVLNKLDVPYSAENTFTFSEIKYGKKHIYFIRGYVETKYANNKVETSDFTAFVKANGNNYKNYEIITLDLKKKK